MKKIFWILLSILIVSACASEPLSPYRATKGSGYGYKEKSLGANSYSVEFKVANGNVKKAEDYAILRAAELTTLQGYDWFEVKKRYSRDDKFDKRDKKFNDSDIYSREQISRECGLLGCRSQIHNMPESEFNNEILRAEASAVLEISFGKGVRPAKQNIYDALEISETLRYKLSLH
jgi:hypothetical protein